MIIASAGIRTGICYFTVCYFYASSKTVEKPLETARSIKYAGITHEDDEDDDAKAYSCTRYPIEHVVYVNR